MDRSGRRGCCGRRRWRTRSPAARSSVAARERRAAALWPSRAAAAAWPSPSCRRRCARCGARWRATDGAARDGVRDGLDRLRGRGDHGAGAHGGDRRGRLARASRSWSRAALAARRGARVLGDDGSRALARRAARRRLARPARRARGCGAVLAVLLAFGAAVGVVQVAVPAFADEHGSAATGGLLLAALSARQPGRRARLRRALVAGHARARGCRCCWRCSAPASRCSRPRAPRRARRAARARRARARALHGRRLDAARHVAPPGTTTESFAVLVMGIVAGSAVGNAVGGAIVEGCPTSSRRSSRARSRCSARRSRRAPPHAGVALQHRDGVGGRWQRRDLAGQGARRRSVAGPTSSGSTSRARSSATSRAQLLDALRVGRAVDEQRHERERDAGGERDQRRAGAAVADHRGRVRHDRGLGDPALDADAAAAAARARRVAAVADRHQHRARAVRERLDRAAVEAREVVRCRRFRAEGDVHEARSRIAGLRQAGAVGSRKRRHARARRGRRSASSRAARGGERRRPARASRACRGPVSGSEPNSDGARRAPGAAIASKLVVGVGVESRWMPIWAPAARRTVRRRQRRRELARLAHDQVGRQVRDRVEHRRAAPRARPAR